MGRGIVWSAAERLQMSKSWLLMNEDPAVGTDQSSNLFWGKWRADFVKNAPVEPEAGRWADRTVEAAKNEWSRKVSKGVSKLAGCVQRVKSCQPTGNLSDDDVIKMAAAMYCGMATYSAVRGEALAKPSSSGRPKKRPTCPWIEPYKVLRKSDKFSAAAGALAAEAATGGDGTADEAVGDSPNRRGGFAERPVGVKAAKLHLADARAAEASAAKTDAKVGVALNRIADASDRRADAVRSANELEADRIAMAFFSDPANCDSPEAAQFRVTLGQTMLARARAALARSKAPDSVDAPASGSGGAVAAISAGAAMANGPVGVEQAVAGSEPSGAGAPADGGGDDEGAGVTNVTEGTRVSAFRETPELGANIPEDCGSAPAAGAAVRASADDALNGAAQGGPGRAATAHAPVAGLGGKGRGVDWIAAALAVGAAVNGSNPAGSTRPAVLRAPPTSSPAIVTRASKRRAGAARATAAKRSRTVPGSTDLSAMSSANDPKSTTPPES